MIADRNKLINVEARSREEVWQQYQLEKKLADKLKRVSKEERKALYKFVYDELFRSTPSHPQLVRMTTSSGEVKKLDNELAVVRHFTDRKSRVLEIGAGDCKLAVRVADHVGKVYAIEVSDELTRGMRPPANVELMISDACSLRLPNDSIDFAYSNQVVEHLHPEDCVEQLKNVYEALVPRGKYLCITPNRVNGPWDISRDFDMEACGLHLKEYTNCELAGIFTEAGFSRVQVYLRARGLHLMLPLFPVKAIEFLLVALPFRLRRAVSSWYPLRRVLGISLVATK